MSEKMSKEVTLKVLLIIYSDGRAEVMCEGDKVDCAIVHTIIDYSFKMADKIVGIVTGVIARKLIDEIVRIVEESRGDSKAGVL